MACCDHSISSHEDFTEERPNQRRSNYILQSFVQRRTLENEADVNGARLELAWWVKASQHDNPSPDVAIILSAETLHHRIRSPHHVSDYIDELNWIFALFNGSYNSTNSSFETLQKFELDRNCSFESESNTIIMASETQNGAIPKKQLILNAFVEMCSGHQSPGLWKHPDDHSSDFNSVEHWVELAKLLEAAKFHGIFIADVLGGYDVYKGPRNLDPAIKSGAQWPVNEPLAVVPAMAAVTKSLGFGVTVATTYEQPSTLR